ncbi:MAG: MBL fold metallo-hydrolase [Bacillota bacterium]|nr:MBL fold metallo-hydrolase [Bacillota bacterium]
MLVKCLAVGPMLANCYLVWCEETKDALVIDPGGEGERILAEIKREQLQVKYIVNTHGHVDHIAANHKVKEGTGAKILVHAEDAPLLTSPNFNLSIYVGTPVKGPAADMLLCEGEEIVVGKQVRLSVLHTPGHTRGGICLNAGEAIFTGDTLFAGSIGRTDFPGGSYQDLLNSIKTKILINDDHVLLYPGHGPTSTVGDERKSNPFLL